ncbi:MAG: hypothetical protein ACKO96_38410 [Flammeovirgaceae bacterium]
MEFPSPQAEEKLLKEVIKMSALEYQTQNGQLNLSALKRRNK